ncbi:hypothetical protein PoB_000258600 [Plakobranchus ocellatus]|uniref:Uncharacterized protein n=1 Tax=Plakobranchus ocellatus TaxID=259542 RepID=A0AAV3XZ25_9GAST|nr:hypothetical protein PoB_000258600 [Plakobranchus ocellatus]
MLILSRSEMNKDGQSVPGWNGWVSDKSNTGSDTIHSTVDYMECLSQPITEHSIVQEMLKMLQEMGNAVGQKITFITFDLAVAKMAYSIE